MTIFRNFKNQSAFYNHIYYHVSRINIKQFEIIVHYSEKLKNTRVVKIDKKRLKTASAVLDAVKSRFPGTQDFIDRILREECERKKMIADDVFFLLLNLQKRNLTWINIFVLDLVL